MTPVASKQGTIPPTKRGNPNKTEQEYANRLAYEFPGCAIRFEAISLRMSNGHVYTPDWSVLLPDSTLLLIEVKARGKNGYRQPSYQRAKLAYDQCRVEYPMFKWRWAEKSQGVWNAGQ